jgi:hypothetical protein
MHVRFDFRIRRRDPFLTSESGEAVKAVIRKGRTCRFRVAYQETPTVLSINSPLRAHHAIAKTKTLGC